jgi:hypothetical protein
MSGVPVSVEEKRFLRHIHASGLKLLEPKVTPEGIIYKGLDPGEFGWKQILFLLKSLAQKGHLDEEDYDRAIFCPACDSPHVYSKYACPIDKSIFVRKVTLLQHTTDGYQGEKAAFEKEDRLICPQCSGDLGQAHDPNTRDPTLKEIGFSYECIKGGHKFEKPHVLHFCPDCGSMFDYKTARYIALFSYSLTQQALNLLNEDTDIEEKLEPLYAYLKSKGFDVSYDVTMVGVSGSTHSFDLAAENEELTLLFDYSLGDTSKLVILLGKKMDLPGHEVVLLDFRNNDEMLNLSKVYNIKVIRVQEEGWALVIDSLITKPEEPSKKNLTRRGLWGRKRE